MAEQNNSFFDRLRKVFSTGVVVKKEGNKTRVVDTENSQQVTNLNLSQTDNHKSTT